MEAQHARKTTTPQATGHRSSAWDAREREPSSARTGLPSLAQARPKAQGLQANRPCSTSGRRHPAKLRHSQCSFYAIFNVGFTLGIIGTTLAQPPDQRIARILGHAFRSRPLPENASRSECSFRDVVSARGPAGKARPGLEAESGMQFPLEGRSGNGIPFWSQNLRCAFRQGSQRDSASYSEQQFRGALRYPRLNISANEISLVSPPLAAAS